MDLKTWRRILKTIRLSIGSQWSLASKGDPWARMSWTNNTNFAALYCIPMSFLRSIFVMPYKSLQGKNPKQCSILIGFVAFYVDWWDKKKSQSHVLQTKTQDHHTILGQNSKESLTLLHHICSVIRVKGHAKSIRGHWSLQGKNPKQCPILILKMSLFTNITAYTFKKNKKTRNRPGISFIWSVHGQGSKVTLDNIICVHPRTQFSYSFNFFLFSSFFLPFFKLIKICRVDRVMRVGRATPIKHLFF